MKAPIIDNLLYPPFEGFPKEGIEFLRKLRRNNNRPWFTAHKGEYEEFVKLPMQSLIAALAISMHDYAPDYDADPKRAMFRIYRDTRFSRDKTPYKTHAAANFAPKGMSKGDGGLYVHIEPGEIYIGGGIYMPDSEQLRSIRRAIALHPDEFRAIVDDRAFRKTYETISGERTSRVPQGFDRDHPLKEYLCLKQFYAGASLDESACTTSKFVGLVHKHFKIILPLVEFLNTAIKSGGR